ncbi:MAG TPA: alpha/beta hydrolase, partial [Miltoncostaeaceae bacterium]|nr:alpha/beta hydrolase [Miltoncostaeaceae bacterium]
MPPARAYLILHGLANHRPPGHWQRWLAERLRSRGETVVYPGLPAADAPRRGPWEAALREHLTSLAGRERIVVCHSLACLLWLGAGPWAAGPEGIGRLLLVAPPASELVPPEGADLRLEGMDAAAVRAGVAAPIRIACSDGDPYAAPSTAERYAERLGAELDVVSG